MLVAKIDVTKIQKEHLFQGAKAKYLDIALHDNRDGVDQYGNSGFITQGVSKEARERGEKGGIIGNFKIIGAKPVPKAESEHIKEKSNGYQPQPDEADDIPF